MDARISDTYVGISVALTSSHDDDVWRPSSWRCCRFFRASWVFWVQFSIFT